MLWIIPLKRKTGKERRPDKMWVDRGREFYNKDAQKLVDFYSTDNEEKTCAIERFNRIIKKKMFKNFSASNRRKFLMYLTYLYISTIIELIHQ